MIVLHKNVSDNDSSSDNYNASSYHRVPANYNRREASNGDDNSDLSDIYTDIYNLPRVYTNQHMYCIIPDY